MSDRDGSYCANCNYKFRDDETGRPCPKCGGTERIAKVFPKASLSVSSNVGALSIREWAEQNQKLVLLVAALTVFSALSGFFIGGSVGVVVDLVLGITAFFLGFRTGSRHKDTDRRGA